jgi:hypothetical protein
MATFKENEVKILKAQEDEEREILTTKELDIPI